MDIDLSKLKGYHKNPRKITSKQFDDLRDSLIELGDISGIIINKPTMELIGGNMRDKIIKSSLADVEWVSEFNPPTKAGTLALGYVIYEGEKYTVRLVDWDEETCEVANIRANKMGGTFDFDILANEFEMETLIKSGFTKEELEGFDFDEEDEYEDMEGSNKGMSEGSSEGSPTICIIFKDIEGAEENLDLIKQFVEDNMEALVSFSSN